MQKIIPFLWFDDKAEEAANFYVSVFKNLGGDKSEILNAARYGEEGSKVSGMPKETVTTISFMLYGQEFIALNGGPYFKFTPAVSFLVRCDTKEETEILWEKLSSEGKVLMEFSDYPFSERYGWVEDKYGLSWQVMLDVGHKLKQKIIPALMFTGEKCGASEEAINFYTSIFKDSEIHDIFCYDKDEEPEIKGTVKYASFILQGQEFLAMDSARSHNFNFNEAVSFVVNCETQEEIDYFWENLSSDPKAEQCGWLRDKYGVSLQIVPAKLDKMMRSEDPEKSERVMKAMLEMKKLDIKALEEAYGHHS